jgi:hypothetical protein
MERGIRRRNLSMRGPAMRRDFPSKSRSCAINRGIFIRWVMAVSFVFAWIGLGTPARAQANDRGDWQPEKTWVFLVDVLLYQGDEEKDIPRSWLEIPASAVMDQFRTIGVPNEQMMLLQRTAATAANVDRQLGLFLRRTRPGDMLVFYFSGHGGRNTLSMHDRKVPKAGLIHVIETHFRGDRAMLFIDTCYSGGVVELAAAQRGRISYAALSSTFSQQSASSGCRFLQCMLRGFAGNPVVDLDRDGHVTFNELCRYSERYMAFAAEGKPIFVTTGQFDSQFRLAKSTGRLAPRVGELVERNDKGQWHKAEILENSAKGLKIHYTRNTRPDKDEIVSADVLRVPLFDKFRVGQTVQVLSGVDDKWHSARVLDTFENLHLCRCNDLPPTNDEWYGPSRIRASSR